MRKAIVAGQFYSSRRDELIGQIKECFLSKFGPGEMPEKKEEKKKRKLEGPTRPQGHPELMTMLQSDRRSIAALEKKMGKLISKFK